MDIKTFLADLFPALTGPQVLARNTATTDGDDLPQLDIIALPEGLHRIDLTAERDKIATKLQPWRRTGTAKMQDLQSLIAWAIRHKGADSAMFANVSTQPSLTCIADYMGAGAPVTDHISRDPAASYCRHRAHYTFPLSREWQVWSKISGQSLNKADLGNFVESNAKDFLQPSAQLISGGDLREEWEKAFLLIAQQVRGRFGSSDSLITLSRNFEVNEVGNIRSSRNPDTGESSFQFVNEHQQPDGNPITIPTLFLLAIPVFENGALYRLAVRFRYQKAGADLKFFLTLHNPDLALRDAVEEALTEAQAQTGLPLFRGEPEQIGA